MIDISEFNNIISLIKITDDVFYEDVNKIKGRIIFIDNSYLDFREVCIKNNLCAYSYYWISKNKSILIGWYNAPHHNEVKPFPIIGILMVKY